MGRVTGPLEQMGARFDTAEGGRLPLSLTGGGLTAIVYRLPVASAQVKSAVLLAGLNAAGETEVIEPEPTRDHTERMLRAFGGEVDVEDCADGVRHVRVRPAQRLTAAPVRVPGDPSSAAFPLVAALITPGLGGDGRGRAAEPPARRPDRDPARDGRGPRDRGTPAKTAASRSATSPRATRR